MKTLLRTRDLPASDRLAYWQELCARLVVPVEVTSASTPFDAELSHVQLGPVQVSALSTGSCEVRRTPRLIRSSEPGMFQLDLLLSGHNVLAQDDAEHLIGPGDMVLYDTSRPFGVSTSPDQGNARGIMVMFPRALLPLSPRQTDRFAAMTFSGRGGVGTLMAEFLVRLAKDGSQYRPDDATRLGTVLVDLLATLVAREFEGGDATPPETRQRSLLMRIQAFIHQNLGDPELSPGLIAAAHDISTRSLHRLFRSQGSTVAEWIRERRLERCRRDLADPSLHHRSIQAVAATWGFTEPAHFSRLFRAAYGVSAQEYRQQHRGPGRPYGSTPVPVGPAANPNALAPDVWRPVGS